jgi:hypothetical protein
MASSCVLRITGDNFQPHDFLQHSNLEPSNIFHKGEQRSAKSEWNSSGITVEISSKDDFSAQIQDAVIFLQTNRAVFWTNKPSTSKKKTKSKIK